MLIRFEVANFRSILEPVELSMVAIDERPDVTRFERIGLGVVPVAGVFGPNASGKSNVLEAIAWLSTAVRDSVTVWDEEIPIEQFAFGNARTRDTSFAVDLEIGGIRFEYLVELNRDRVSYEGLFQYPEGRKRRIFEREGNQLTLQRGLGVLSGARKLLSRRSLALSVMRRFDEPLTSSVSRALTGMQIHFPMPRQMRLYGSRQLSSTLRYFEDPEPEVLEAFRTEEHDAVRQRSRALAFLRLADLGVDDVEVEIREVAIPGTDGRVINQRVPHLVHVVDHERVPFDFASESGGTQTWFRLLGPVLDALEQGHILVFDEIEAGLHPVLTAELLKLFKSPASNPNGAQLVFSTHDTNLLNHLNRDEVWLTQKERDGSTHFAALSDFAEASVRRSENLERGYLSGRYGALPDTFDPPVLRDLGLIQ